MLLYRNKIYNFHTNRGIKKKEYPSHPKKIINQKGKEADYGTKKKQKNENPQVRFNIFSNALKNQRELSYDAGFLFLSKYLKNKPITLIQKDSFMFIAALFTVAKILK